MPSWRPGPSLQLVLGNLFRGRSRVLGTFLAFFLSTGFVNRTLEVCYGEVLLLEVRVVYILLEYSVCRSEVVQGKFDGVECQNRPSIEWPSLARVVISDPMLPGSLHPSSQSDRKVTVGYSDAC